MKKGLSDAFIAAADPFFLCLIFLLICQAHVLVVQEAVLLSALCKAPSVGYIVYRHILSLIQLAQLLAAGGRAAPDVHFGIRYAFLWRYS